LNDINGEIVTLYKILQNDKLRRRLIARLKMTPYSRTEYDNAHEPATNPIERCRRLIIRSLMGYYADSVITSNYKSGFRNDLDRKYTIPAHEWVDYANCLDCFAERLLGVVIEHFNAFDLFAKWRDKPYLWYIDPPYVHRTRTRPNKHCYVNELSDTDHRKMIKAIQKLTGMVIISGYDNVLYRPLEQHGWRKVTKIYNNNTFQSGMRTECLWINPAAQEAKRLQQEVFKFEEAAE